MPRPDESTRANAGKSNQRRSSPQGNRVGGNITPGGALEMKLVCLLTIVIIIAGGWIVSELGEWAEGQLIEGVHDGE